MANFDPTSIGATPVTQSSNNSTFNPSTIGATPVVSTPNNQGAFDPTKIGGSPVSTSSPTLSSIVDSIANSVLKPSTPSGPNPNAPKQSSPLDLPSETISATGSKPTPSLTGATIKPEPQDNFNKPVNELPWYLQPGRAALDTLKNALGGAADAGTNFVQSLMGMSGKMNNDGTMDTTSLNNSQKITQRVTDGLNLGIGALGLAISPLNAILQGATKMPVVGNSFQKVNDAFQSANDIALPTATLIGNKLPISEDQKPAAINTLQNILSNFIQFGLGGIAHGELTAKITPLETDLKNTIEQGKSGVTQSQPNAMGFKPENIPQPTTEEALGSKGLGGGKNVGIEEPRQFQEPLKTAEPQKVGQTNEKPTILPIEKVSSGLAPEIEKGMNPEDPKIQKLVEDIKSGKNVPPVPVFDKGDGTYGLNKDGAHKLLAHQIAGTTDLPVDIQDKTDLSSTQKQAVERGKTINVRTAKSASDATDMANIYHISAEYGFEDMPESEKAKYSPTTVKEQVQKVGDLMKNNMDDARSIIRGEKSIPNGMSPQVLFNAMEKYAIANKDGELMNDLVKSPISSKLSTGAQEMGLHGHTDNPHSPVEAVREITKAREADYLKKNGGESVLKSKKAIVDTEGVNLEKEIKTAASKRPDWESFIRQLACQA